MDKNSMMYWYPFAELTDIPMPKTIIIWVGNFNLLNMLDNHKPLPNHIINFIKLGAEEIGYPLFLRTDHASAKHDWKNTCYVPSEDVLMQHVYEVVEFNSMAGIIGLPFQAIVLREYIPLESAFTAFRGDMPVAKERRYFIRDGQVECHHPYWIEEAIKKETTTLPENWQELLKELNKEDEEEINLLTFYAEQLGKYLRQYWSVDFAKGKDGKWYFIDAALGEQSWHPPCPKNKMP
ncbi:MAG: ATP-grasp domain-containing protein [Bacteroidales bacterium]|nr:ATP-grasp domain-containing protein [Bacteroidales bacterium]